MKIGGITAFSLLDFPGKVSCIVFTPGCNFRCLFCHNPDFVLPNLIKKQKKYFIPEETFFSFLKKRKGLLEGVSICGGEPTVQRDLYDFCKKIKDLGFLIKLDTNGRDPEVLKKLISGSGVDYIAMDIKQSLQKWDDIIGVKVGIQSYKKSIDVLMEGKVNYEFSTTCIKGIHSKKDILSISREIQGAKAYFLQNFKKGNTLQKNFQGESFGEGELGVFREIASKYVESCEIRL